MNELKSISQLVKIILEQDGLARNSDSFLYFRVLAFVAEKKGINLFETTVPDFLLHMKSWGLPGFETVRRARQKVQQHNPELASDERIAALRQAEEVAYRAFANGGAV